MRVRVCFLPRERRERGECLRARFCFDPLPHPLLIHQSIPFPLSGDAAAVSKFAADVDALKKRVGMPDDADLEAAVAAQRLKTARGDVRRVINAASVDGVDDAVLADVTAALEAAEKESGAPLTDGNGKGWSAFAAKLAAVAKARGLDDVAKVRASATAATYADTVASLKAAAADAMQAAARRDGLDAGAAPPVASLKPKW